MNRQKSRKEILDEALQRLGNPSLKELETARKRVSESLKGGATAAGEASSHTLLNAEPASVWALRQPFLIGIAAASVIAIASVAIFRNPVQIVDTPAAEVRRTNDEARMLALPDGSRVEMRPHSELSVERADDGPRIRLNRGEVIVNAAPQRGGHLHVQTKDVSVSVIGAVFLVNAEDTGSRVVVIEGEVQVQQGAASKKLLPGEQLATSAAMSSISLIEEIAWSSHAAEYLTLWQQAIAVAPSLLPPATPPTRSQLPEPGPTRASITPASLHFEADSVKADTRGGRSMLLCQGVDMAWGPNAADFAVPKGRCVGDSVTLMTLISGAYRTPVGDIAGGPSWIDARNVTFQVEGKAEDTANATTEELRRMLQTLLAERFKLQFHRETKDSSGYVLLAGKKAARFKQASSDEHGVVFRNPVPGQMVYELKGQPMSSLVDLLSSLMHSPVLDRTSLTGNYDLTLSLNNPGGRIPKKDPGPGLDFDPPIPMVVQDQLGLRLASQKVPVDILVVDYAEKPLSNSPLK